jgi:hypothetical protein
MGVMDSGLQQFGSALDHLVGVPLPSDFGGSSLRAPRRRTDRTRLRKKVSAKGTEALLQASVDAAVRLVLDASGEDFVRAFEDSFPTVAPLSFIMRGAGYGAQLAAPARTLWKQEDPDGYDFVISTVARLARLVETLGADQPHESLRVREEAAGRDFNADLALFFYGSHLLNQLAEAGAKRNREISFVRAVMTDAADSAVATAFSCLQSRRRLVSQADEPVDMDFYMSVVRSA